jgi:hypothetical protein
MVGSRVEGRWLCMRLGLVHDYVSEGGAACASTAGIGFDGCDGKCNARDVARAAVDLYLYIPAVTRSIQR